MESNFDHDNAQAHLNMIEADRQRMSALLPVPWALMVASGAATAWFVADAATAHPGADYQANSGYLLTIAVLFLVVHFISRETGVKFRRLGLKGWLAALGIAVWTLAMFSGTLALVSAGYRLWSVIPVLLTWVVGTLGSAAIFRSCVQVIQRG